MDQWFKKKNSYPCPPDMSELKNMLENFDSEKQADELDEAKEAINCLETTLLLYNIFTTSPNKNVVNEMYNRTLELIEGAYDSRRIQEDNVRDQYNDAMDSYIQFDCGEDFEETLAKGEPPHNYKNMSPFCQKLVDGVLAAKDILEQFKEDYKQLDNLKEPCENVSLAQEKILCVENFVHAAHTRGPYLPTGCGFRLPEEILSTDNYDYMPFDELGPVAERITEDTLDCLAGK